MAWRIPPTLLHFANYSSGSIAWRENEITTTKKTQKKQKHTITLTLHCSMLWVIQIQRQFWTHIRRNLGLKYYATGVVSRGNAWERHSQCMLKFLRTPKMHAIGYIILHLQYQNFSWGNTPGLSDQDANLRLARQRFHCSCFTKRPLLRARSVLGFCVRLVRRTRRTRWTSWNRRRNGSTRCARAYSGNCEMWKTTRWMWNSSERHCAARSWPWKEVHRKTIFSHFYWKFISNLKAGKDKGI